MPTNSKPDLITSKDLDSLVAALRPTALPQLVRDIDKRGHGFWGTSGHVQVVGTLVEYFWHQYPKEFKKASMPHVMHALDVAFFIGMYLGSTITSLRASRLKPIARKRRGDVMKQWEAAVKAKKTRGTRKLQFETVEAKTLRRKPV